MDAQKILEIVLLGKNQASPAFAEVADSASAASDKMAESADAAAADSSAAADKVEANNARLSGSYDATAISAGKSAETQSLAADKSVESSEKTKVASASSGSGFSKLGLGAAAAAVGIGIVADKTVKAAVEYQTQLTDLVTGAGESEKNVGMIGKSLLTMAEDTGTSTTQLTSGLFMIESAGYHGAAGLSVLKAAAEGAKVGNADLGTVSDATTTIMKDFGGTLPTQAVNTLIATVASGKTHMEDLAGAMSQVLPTASATKVGLNDVMGAMATMTGEGVPAANAATYLRQTMLALDAPGQTAVTALSNVGLKSSDVAAEMQKSLPGAMQMITDAVGKKFPVGSAGYVSALKDIMGGSKTLQGALDLTGSHAKDFTANVANISDEVKKGGQQINGWADVQKDASFKVSQLKESVQTSGIALGEGLLPALTKTASALADFLKPLAEWVEKHQKLAAAVMIAVGAFAIFITTILAITKMVKIVGGVFDTLGSVFKIAKGVFSTGWQVAKVIAGFVKTAASAVVSAATTAAGWIAGAAASAAAWVIANAVMIGGILLIVAVVAVVVYEIIKHWNDVKQWFDDAVGWMKSHWELIVAIIFPFMALPMLIVAKWGVLKQWFDDLKNDILRIVDDAGSWLLKAGEDIINGLVKGIENAAGNAVNAVKKVGSDITGAAKDVLKIFSPSQVFSDIGSNVSLGLAQGITTTGDKAISATSTLAAGVIGAGSITLPAVGSSAASAGQGGNGGVTIQSGGSLINIQYEGRGQFTVQDATSMAKEIVIAMRGQGLSLDNLNNMASLR
jgi:TP901 family phage tail tape measure protein